MLQLNPNIKHLKRVRTLIQNHLDDLRHNRLPQIQKTTGYTIDQIREAWEELKKLDPKPASCFADQFVPSVTPDLRVKHDSQGDYVVEMDEGPARSLYISKYYRQRLANGQATAEEKEFIKRKITAAQWLIESIEQRRSTLTRVAQAIVDRSIPLQCSVTGNIFANQIHLADDRAFASQHRLAVEFDTVANHVTAVTIPDITNTARGNHISYSPRPLEIHPAGRHDVVYISPLFQAHVIGWSGRVNGRNPACLTIQDPTLQIAAQSIKIDLPCIVATQHFSHMSGSVTGNDRDDGRLLNEVECTGDNVSLG